MGHKPIERYEHDREQLLAWQNLSLQVPPAHHLREVTHALGYRYKKRRTALGDCSVDFAHHRVCIHPRAALHRERAVTAAAKALGHIRLHARQPPAAYRDWWHWEAQVYGAVFLCPRHLMLVPDFTQLGERATWRWLGDTARQLGCTPSCLRVALEAYGLLRFTWKLEGQVVPMMRRQA